MKDPQAGTRSLSRTFARIADDASFQQLIDIASLFRILLVVMMAFSCMMYQNQFLILTQDDSLVTFPLRLVEDLPPPFALPNSFCRSSFIPKYLTITETYVERPSRMWSFLLTPLTRWDAARFLKIAHEPMIRYPQHQYSHHLFNHLSSEKTDFTTGNTCPNLDHVLQVSEEAHAFLPLFPTLIQGITAFLLLCVPATILPPTCESSLVLASYLLNTFCFLWSAKQLYFMTKLIVEKSTLEASPQRIENSSSKQRPGDSDALSTSPSDQWACRVLLLYIINPASVFFATTYSESLAAALIFTGHHWMLQYQFAKKKSIFLLIATWLIWFLGCHVRSNGTINAGFLFLYGFGGILSSRSQTTNRTLTHFSLVLGSILLVVGSIGWHNYNAYQDHCVVNSVVFHGASSTDAVDDCQLYQKPAWCTEGPYFNLYSYVQRKYWNVGFLRYYEWTQLPNFLLAAPVLCLAIVAVVNWIRISWNRYPMSSEPKYYQRPYHLIRWAILALKDFVKDDQSFSESTEISRSEQPSGEMVLLGHPKLLGHFAVLAASTVICLTLAHVQISTRMIFSTCPAIYWFLVVKICNHTWLGNAILYWSFLYIVMGIIMHPNWLPWT
jgi:GPI mannosyltransferase 2